MCARGHDVEVGGVRWRGDASGGDRSKNFRDNVVNEIVNNDSMTEHANADSAGARRWQDGNEDDKTKVAGNMGMDMDIGDGDACQPARKRRRDGGVQPQKPPHPPHPGTLSAQISATTKRGCRPWAGSPWGPGNRGADLLLPLPPPQQKLGGTKSKPPPPNTF